MTRSLLEVLTRHRRALLFLSWAATLLVLIKLDRYRTFLRPEFGIILEAAYVILLLLLTAELWRRNEAHLHGSLLLSPAILLLPILFILNAQGVKLDSYAFEKRSVGAPRVMAQEIPPDQSAPGEPTTPDNAPVTPSNSPSAVRPTPATGSTLSPLPGSPSTVPSLPPQQPSSASRIIPVTHLDLYNSPRQFEGKWVSLVGMTYRNEEARKEFGTNAILVFRFVVTCCAADAQPIAVVVDRKQGQPDLPDNVWVKVQGHFTTRKLRGDKVPFIDEAVLSPTPEPQPPYLY